jgi:hypothetical protein
MKRATFKKPFNGMDNALKLIPESYKVDGNEFELTDGVETYRVRWDINEATVLRAENKNLISEDMQKIKHLMGFKSQDTLGNLKGEQRIVENKSFGDVWDKTKKLLNEADENDSSLVEQAFGMGFTNECYLEENEPVAEMQREEEGVDEVVSVSKLKDRQMSDINKDYDIKDPNITEEDDNGDMIQAVENYFKKIQQNSTLMGYLETIQKNPNAQKQAITHFAEVVGVPSNKLSAIVTDIKADAKDAQMEGTLNEGVYMENEDSNIEYMKGKGDVGMELIRMGDKVAGGINWNNIKRDVIDNILVGLERGLTNDVAADLPKISNRPENLINPKLAEEYMDSADIDPSRQRKGPDADAEARANKKFGDGVDPNDPRTWPDGVDLSAYQTEGEMCAECGDGMYEAEPDDVFERIFEDLYLEEGEKTECSKCEGEGCDHCGGTGYHMNELENPEKADLNKDGEISSYEEKRGEAIEKAMKDDK